MVVSKKIGIAVAIVAIAVGIGLASPLFYQVDIDEPIPTGSVVESIETIEEFADSIVNSATEDMMNTSLADTVKNLTDKIVNSPTEDMMDMSLADMKEMPMMEKAIEMMREKGISTEEMEDMMLDSFKQLDENGEIRQMLESDPNEMMVGMLMNASARTETKASDDDMESMGPIILKSGTFTGIGGHRASGLAKIIDVEGTNYLRFEDFSVTNGPDLRVYVTSDGNINNGFHLEKLKGSRGAQNYMLGDIDIEKYNTVVIYCQPFGAYFANAPLSS